MEEMWSATVVVCYPRPMSTEPDPTANVSPTTRSVISSPMRGADRDNLKVILAISP